MKVFGAILVLCMLLIAAWARAEDKAAAIPNCEENLKVVSRLAYGTWKSQRDQYEQMLAAAQVRIADLEQQLAAAKKSAEKPPEPKK